MKRNPKDVVKNNYINGIKIKKIKPRFFWYECECCKQEYKNEFMYLCTEPSLCFTWYYYYRGCTNCFTGKKDFRQWLLDNNYLLDVKEFDIEDNRKLLI